MKRLKLMKGWQGHTVGTILEVDGETAKELTGDGTAEIYAEVSHKGAKTPEELKTDAEAQTKVITDAVTATLKGLAGSSTKGVHISVHDRTDDDPTFGFLDGCTAKSVKDLSSEEVSYAFGLMARDVAKAAQSGGRVSEKLMKCQERAKAVITKAAGDGLVVNSDEDGGYMIFSAAQALINQSNLENAIVRPRANRITMSTQLLQIPYARDNDHSSGTVYGGIKIFFDDENGAGTESKPKGEKMEFKLKKMTAMGYASEEWVKWAPVTLGSWLIPKFGEGMAFKEDLVFIGGKGGSQPLGIRNSAAKLTIAREAGQTAATFVLENSAKMFARLKVRNEGKLVWLMNRSTFPQLPKFNISAGTGGAPVFTNNVQGAPGQSLWGVPIVWTEKIPSLGTIDAVMLVDFSDYTIADDQSGPAIAQSQHLKFDLGQQAFRIVKYIDGQPETITPFQGVHGDTLSPVVSLPA